MPATARATSVARGRSVHGRPPPAFKPFARDGSIAFLPGAVTVTPLTPGGITNLPCSMTASDRPVTGDTRVIPGTPLTVTSTPASLAVERQTTN